MRPLRENCVLFSFDYEKSRRLDPARFLHALLFKARTITYSSQSKFSEGKWLPGERSSLASPEQSHYVTEGKAGAIRIIASGNDHGGGPDPKPPPVNKRLPLTWAHIISCYIGKIFFQDSGSDLNVLCTEQQIGTPSHRMRQGQI